MAMIYKLPTDDWVLQSQLAPEGYVEEVIDTLAVIRLEDSEDLEGRLGLHIRGRPSETLFGVLLAYLLSRWEEDSNPVLSLECLAIDFSFSEAPWLRSANLPELLAGAAAADEELRREGLDKNRTQLHLKYKLASFTVVQELASRGFLKQGGPVMQELQSAYGRLGDTFRGRDT